MNIIIVGAGISGLSLAHALLEKNPDLEITVLESEARPGGKIWSEKAEGFLCEAGVNGFLDNKPATLSLAGRLGIEPLRSNDAARKRAIFNRGKLWMLPEKPLAFMTSNFLSLSGRLRMAGEYFIPGKKLDDESMESFAKRRVGREFFDKLLDPMASGIYAGDPAKMSIRSCFSKVYELEKNHGGLLKGFMALGREAKRSGRKAEAGPGGVLYSFRDGMLSLIESLRARLGKRVITGKEVKGIDRKNGSFTVHCGDGSEYESDCVVLASPAHSTAGIIREFDRDISSLLRDIPYPPISVVALGYEKAKIFANTNFFGFLMPFKEHRKILGTLFDSSIFPNRAPEGKFLLRSIVGGARAPELALLDDEKLIGAVISELAATAGIKADPEFVRIFRWERAIPQYHVGHYKRLERLDDMLKKHKRLYLHSNAYRGVAVNDCIANSNELAERILSNPHIAAF